MQQMNRLLHASFDRFPRLVESRYDEAFLYLACALPQAVAGGAGHQRDRRSERGTGRPLSFDARGQASAAGRAAARPPVFDAAARISPTPKRSYRAAAAAEMLAWRHQVLTDLRAKACCRSTSFPEELTAPLVNSYLDIKARHLL